MKESDTRGKGQGAREIRLSGFNLSLAPCSLLLAVGMLFASSAFAGAQVYTPLSASVRAVLQRSVSDQAAPRLAFATQSEADAWLNEM